MDNFYSSGNLLASQLLDGGSRAKRGGIGVMSVAKKGATYIRAAADSF